MNDERHKRVKELFLGASDLTPDERAGFLDEACGADASLRAEVEELLTFEREDPDFLAAAPAAVRAEVGADLEAMLQRVEQQADKHGRYEIQGEFARGGMGAILRVWDRQLGRPLAMKVVLGQGDVARTGDTPNVDERTLGRFLEEAQITGRLDHPGIVPVHELGVDADRQVYFTMKLVEGRDLKAIFELVASGQEGWTQTRALGVLLKVCQAMAYAHSKQIVHRDLKPANIMVGPFGEVYVMDWGLAHAADQADKKDLRIRRPDAPMELGSSSASAPATGGDSPVLTMDGDVVGTPAYMSPEQARGEIAAMGPASDVYSVGAILYQLLAGQRPYVAPGARLDGYQILARVQSGAPTPLSTIASDAPGELVAICEKAMGRDIIGRYPDMGAMADDLQAFLERRVVHAYEAGAWAEARKWIQRNKPLAVSALAGILILLGGAATIAVVTERNNQQLAVKNLDLTLSEAEAKDARTLADSRLVELSRLSAWQDLADLLVAADSLWPAHPERIEEYTIWIERASALVAELPVHRAKRDELRALALPRTEEERSKERSAHPDSTPLRELELELERQENALARRKGESVVHTPAEFGPLVHTGNPNGLAKRAEALFLRGRDDEAQDMANAALEAASASEKESMGAYYTELVKRITAATSVEGFAQAEEALAVLEDAYAAMDGVVDKRRDWQFPSEHEGARWWHDQLTKLVEGLESLQDEETGLLTEDAVSPGHGWSVPKRLAVAQELSRSEHERSWKNALPRIEKTYPELGLSIQMGLVPIDQDPASELWEFWHVASGARPERDGEGKIQITGETGMVMVLLPAGTFNMGAQSVDANGPNHDRDASGHESPVHLVELSAFFLSKYELTQGQWLRATGSLPSTSSSKKAEYDWTLLHPVETLSWNACQLELGRLGLSLPSEAQWEYGCRARSTSPYSCPVPELAAHANLADQAHKRFFDSPLGEEWEDGFGGPAPVGLFAPNAFGFHDVHGNVWEWCLDGHHVLSYATSSRVDPVAPGYGNVPIRMYRGGSFGTERAFARSAHRGGGTPTGSYEDIGVRPARDIDPPWTGLRER